MKNLPTLNYFLKMTTLRKENVLVLHEFLKNKNFVKEKSPSFARTIEK
jgi:hypothetical protein